MVERDQAASPQPDAAEGLAPGAPSTPPPPPPPPIDPVASPSPSEQDEWERRRAELARQERRLAALGPDDHVLVVLANEQTIAFTVRETAHYPYDEAPLKQIFGPATGANLNLITCGGTWDACKRNYSERIVVYASRP